MRRNNNDDNNNDDTISTSVIFITMTTKYINNDINSSKIRINIEKNDERRN